MNSAGLKIIRGPSLHLNFGKEGIMQMSRLTVAIFTFVEQGEGG